MNTAGRQFDDEPGDAKATRAVPVQPVRKPGGAVTAPVDFVPKQQVGLWTDAWRRLRKNKIAVVGMVIIVIFLFIAIFADWIAPYPYYKNFYTDAWHGPSPKFWFGNDGQGRDLLSRLIYGTRISLGVSLAGQAMLLAIGLAVGSLAGWFGGWVDTLLMRLVDIMYAFPGILFAIFLMVVFGPGITSLIIVFGLLYWPGIARLVRGQLLSLKQKEFVEAAQSMGAGSGHIIIKHLLPNSLAPLIVQTAFGIPGLIAAEAGLSIVGVGITPPTPSWGSMMNEGLPFMRSYWHLPFFPTLVLVLVMLAFQFLGDGLRDALDPKMRNQ